MPRGLSAREFAIDLKKFGALTVKKSEIVFRKIALELDRGVVMKTPVKTGRARGNWYPSINVSSNAVDVARYDKSGRDTMAAVENNVMSANLGDTVWLTNNLPYILNLENGSSKQAPLGMVDLTLQHIASRYGGSIERR